MSTAQSTCWTVIQAASGTACWGGPIPPGLADSVPSFTGSSAWWPCGWKPAAPANARYSRAGDEPGRRACRRGQPGTCLRPRLGQGAGARGARQHKFRPSKPVTAGRPPCVASSCCTCAFTTVCPYGRSPNAGRRTPPRFTTTTLAPGRNSRRHARGEAIQQSDPVPQISAEGAQEAGP